MHVQTRVPTESARRAEVATSPDDAVQTETPTFKRRGLIAGAVAVVTAIALEQRAEPAAANDPNDVGLGVTNTATAATTINRTNGGSALVLHSDSFGGNGLLATGVGQGVWGTGRVGVFGDTNNSDGAGVQGLARTAGGIGVSGGSAGETGIGVIAGCDTGIGVHAVVGPFQNFREKGPIAVRGHANHQQGLGALLEGGRAPLRLVPRNAVGAPTSGVHEAGELTVDSTGALFYCKADGTPGSWIELGAPAPTPVAAPSVPVLVTLPTPERFVDTRSNLGGVQGPVPAGSTRTFTMTGRPGQSGSAALQIPDTATTIVGNLTVVGAAGVALGSYVTLWPSGPQPTVSNINFGPSTVTGAVANSYVVGLSASNGHGHVQVFNQSPCDYILDVTGYYVPS